MTISVTDVAVRENRRPGPYTIQTGRGRTITILTRWTSKDRKIMVYFHRVGESILDNMIYRRARPYTEYRKVLGEVLVRAGMDPELMRIARWSQRAGCTCPCSPGFAINQYGDNIHVYYTMT